MMTATPAGHRRRIIVTGGAQGIGRAIVEALAADAEIVSVDRNTAVNQALARELTARGLAVTARTADVTDRASIRDALAPFEAIDVLVNNAGAFWPCSVEAVSADDLRRMFDVTVVAAMLMVQEALERMPDGGRILNMASRAYLGAAGYPHYVAAKAGLVGLTRALALDLAERRIAVNAVAPGIIATEMTAEIRARTRPDPRFVGEPAAVASLVRFLALDADFITGQVLVVDGGRSVGLANS